MCLHIPNLQCCVLTSRNQQSGIGAECALVDWSNVSSEGVDELPISCVPKLGMVIEATTGDQQPIGRECDVVDLFLVTLQTRNMF